jgi:hypothetical protein
MACAWWFGRVTRQVPHRAFCAVRNDKGEFSGCLRERQTFSVGSIAAHPFDSAQGRLLQKTQGWGTQWIVRG